MIDVTCPKCGAVYHSEQAHIGKQLKCVKCGGVVPIVVPPDRTVVSRQPTIPSAKGQTAYDPAKKHRRIYGFGITAVVMAAVVLSVVFLRPTSVSKQGIHTPSNVQEQPSSPSSQNAENTGNWQVVDAEPVAAPGQQAATDGRKPTEITDPRPTDYNSLPTGTRIEEDIGIGGHGKLTVENGTSDDAVVRLCDVATDQTLRWFFVQAHSSAHVAKVPRGTYRLAFTTGLNWVESEDTFSWHPSYSEFDKTFEFSERRDSEGVQYKAISVTLNPVMFGNVKTKTITREEFLRGHRHVVLQR
jgi:hypothetical protein